MWFVAMLKRFPLFLVLPFIVFSGCGPNKAQVSNDFQKIIAKEIGSNADISVSEFFPGEGDGQNVYVHVEFDIVFQKNMVFKNGWFSGLSFKAGEKNCGGQAIVLYQKDPIGGGPWKASRSQFQKAPSPCKDR
jgi:hypothetical protein